MTAFFQDSFAINLIIELPVLGVMGDRPDEAKPHNQFFCPFLSFNSVKQGVHCILKVVTRHH